MIERVLSGTQDKIKRKTTSYFNQCNKNPNVDIQMKARDVEGEKQHDSEAQEGQTDPDRTE